MASQTMTSKGLRNYTGFRASPRMPATRAVSLPAPGARSRRPIKTTCDFIGSTPNIIMVGCTALCLAAGRFGFAPTANKVTNVGLKLQDTPSGMKSGDPAGFTAVDCLALGSFGHCLGAGIILGLRGIGKL